MPTSAIIININIMIIYINICACTPLNSNTPICLYHILPFLLSSLTMSPSLFFSLCVTCLAARCVLGICFFPPLPCVFSRWWQPYWFPPVQAGHAAYWFPPNKARLLWPRLLLSLLLSAWNVGSEISCVLDKLCSGMRMRKDWGTFGEALF